VRILRGEPAGGPATRLEPLGVHAGGLGRQQVPRGTRAHHVAEGSELRPEPANRLVQRVRRVIRRLLPPQCGDQPGRRDGGVRLEEQRGQERAGPLARDRDPLGSGLGLERTEDAEEHRRATSTV
jgi:hypothetical protein